MDQVLVGTSPLLRRPFICEGAPALSWMESQAAVCCCSRLWLNLPPLNHSSSLIRVYLFDAFPQNAAVFVIKCKNSSLMGFKGVQVRTGSGRVSHAHAPR